MSGKYLLDTNVLIYAIDRKLKLPKSSYGISVITKLELLSWPQLSDHDERQLAGVLANISVVELAPAIQEAAIRVRRATSLKLPDSIISATAMQGGYVLVTNDDKLRNRHVGDSITLETLLEAVQ